jgi:hypothetical protein
MTLAVRNAWYRWALVLALGLPALACGPSVRGAISADGFRHNDYACRVLPMKDGRLMGEAWKLDNFYEDDEFDADSGQTKKVTKPKDGKNYVVEYQLDHDGDGEVDAEVEELVYDLRFEHREHDGVVFLRTIPLSTDMKHKKLSVLMDRYVEQIAGAGYEVVSLNSKVNFLVEKRYAAALVSKSATKVAGRDAYIAILDVANIDQLKIDPKARKERVELVLLHTDFVYRKESGTPGAPVSEFPVLMFAGYANTPDEFAIGESEFHDFLNRIEIDQRRGFVAPELEPAVEKTVSEETRKPSEEATGAASSPPPESESPEPSPAPAE